MQAYSWIAAAAVTALLLSIQLAYPNDDTGKDGGPSGTFSYVRDAQVAAVQRKVKAVVEPYQDGLNSSDFAKIRPLFAPDAVAAWNEKATVIGALAMAKPYETLFQAITFNTDFQDDAVDTYGEIAIVQTHHPSARPSSTLRTGRGRWISTAKSSSSVEWTATGRSSSTRSRPNLGKASSEGIATCWTQLRPQK